MKLNRNKKNPLERFLELENERMDLKKLPQKNFYCHAPPCLTLKPECSRAIPSLQIL
jgi:hypothetical protein